MMRLRTVVLLPLLLCAYLHAVAQSEPAGRGPGSYIQAGIQVSGYQADYGQRKLGGVAAFVDANLYRRVGVEAEARTFTNNQDQGAHETTYLVGPRVSLLAGRLRPYVKLLAGKGEFSFPFNYAHGSYFAVAAGGGVDWYPHGRRLSLRVIDIEIQDWPSFSYGPLRPYGISSGVALRVR